jgi:hypothetical protein
MSFGSKSLRRGVGDPPVEDNMLIRLLRPIALVLVLAGCTATAQVPDGLEFRSENWYQAIESGFVVAPVWPVSAVTDPEAAAATFTSQFFVALNTSLPGTSLASPDDARYRLRKAGEETVDRADNVREALIAGQPVDPADLTELSRALEHRYLMMSWMEEGVDEGIDEMVHDVYSSVESSEDVRRFAYEKVTGRATAVVLDLWENEVLWRAAADYSTARLYGDDGAIRRELAKTREAAATRLAEFVSIP